MKALISTSRFLTRDWSCKPVRSSDSVTVLQRRWLYSKTFISEWLRLNDERRAPIHPRHVPEVESQWDNHMATRRWVFSRTQSAPPLDGVWSRLFQIET
jgi:hypothetical protein